MGMDDLTIIPQIIIVVILGLWIRSKMKFGPK